MLRYGWSEGWAEPDEGPQDAPRFRLLRIQRAFWEREVRFTRAELQRRFFS